MEIEKEQEQDEDQDQESIVENPEVHYRHLKSMDASLKIRQITSQGLSFQLWPAATTFVTLLDAHRRDPAGSPLAKVLSGPRSLTILELGSGTGLVGLAAAATLGARVTLTDLPHVVPNLEFNAAANEAVVRRGGGSATVSALSWGETAEAGEYDVVVASDVVYHDHLYEPLLQTLYGLLLGKGRSVSFVMAHLKRWKKESVFFKKARKAFVVEVLFEDTPLEGSRLGVVVYRFSAKLNNGSNPPSPTAQL